MTTGAEKNGRLVGFRTIKTICEGDDMPFWTSLWPLFVEEEMSLGLII